ncbi:MAG: 50S ribosomal protein L3 N(5)-glutamine methyltransferase [Hahellaceae bacterium]|nr:50S ribosomal protein L3 N(5)-glutamine methyltransferase [Hahellaceae bacterium]
MQQITENLITIRDYIRFAVSRFNEADLFYGHGTDNAWDEAVYLVLRTLYLPWDIDRSLLDSRLTMVEREVVLGNILRRIENRLPSAYILGEGWFMGLPFNVTQDVLVPRSPISELIQADFQPWMQQAPERILDLCTGSGCIGIACAYQYPEAEVVLSDISAEALLVAESNIDRHKLRDRVQAIQSDVFDNLEGRFDLIVSNPPYVDAGDIAGMPAEFHSEPMLGLAAGDDGLDIARRILREARNYLSEEGLLVVEVGNSWEALEAAYPDVPFTWVEFENGGLGVFIMTAQELDMYADYFA